MAEHEYQRVLKRLASSLKRRRAELSMTQEDVADRLGMVVRQYQKIESGEVNVTLRTLTRIAKVLESRPADLLR